MLQIDDTSHLRQIRRRSYAAQEAERERHSQESDLGWVGFLICLGTGFLEIELVLRLIY